MINKTLHVIGLCRPGGGPSGYLHNLREIIKRSEKELPLEVHAFSYSTERIRKERINQFGLASRLIPPFIKLLFLYILDLRQWVKKIDKKEIQKIASYKVVVFHDVSMLFSYLLWFPRKVGQKIFYMPHAPTSRGEEICESIAADRNSNLFYNTFIKVFTWLELYCYKRIDGILIPTPESIDSYYLFNKKAKNKFNLLDKSFAITGLDGLKPSTRTETVREELEIKEDEIAVAFIGRFHPHKGFDVFIKVSETLKHNNKIKFFCIGSGPTSPPKNITNLGWRQDIANIINGVDIVINCNRHTYFDLLALEVMSLKKPLAVSNKGGNKYLKKLSEGVIIYDLSAPEEIASTLSRLDRKTLEEMGNKNYEVFTKFFDEDSFLNGHKNFSKKALSLS